MLLETSCSFVHRRFLDISSASSLVILGMLEYHFYDRFLDIIIGLQMSLKARILSLFIQNGWLNSSFILSSFDPSTCLEDKSKKIKYWGSTRSGTGWIYFRSHEMFKKYTFLISRKETVILYLKINLPIC